MRCSSTALQCRLAIKIPCTLAKEDGTSALLRSLQAHELVSKVSTLPSPLAPPARLRAFYKRRVEGSTWTRLGTTKVDLGSRKLVPIPTSTVSTNCASPACLCEAVPAGRVSAHSSRACESTAPFLHFGSHYHGSMLTATRPTTRNASPATAGRQ